MSAPPSKEATAPVLFGFPSTDNLSQALATFVLKAQDEALKKQPTFRIAISGGSLPKVLGKDLIGREGVPWDKWEVFFADERVVPLDHEDSNFRLNDEHLFSHVPIPRQNIHVIDTSKLDDPEAVADDYEKQLVASFVGSSSIAFPRFDLVLLGIGPDGHTCSLFPGHALLDEMDGWVAWLNDSPKPPPTRITLTYPVLNHSLRVAFVSTGEGKQEIMKEVLDNPNPKEGLPSSRVRPISPGRVFFFSDDAALKLVDYQRTQFDAAKL
ncbi:hypothetical protein JCM10908_006360 [Rhodotorula pacifica]|uniref:6-phosphogluconolactonase n=1 Tax=Rhodotorula pacifica TaxID=1495444 RepID=UPI0031778544